MPAPPLTPPSPATPAPRAAWVGLGLLALAVAATRAPFLSPGYGTDTDAWKLAYAARFIATQGHYLASRLPGYPIQELVSALAWKGGPLALNGLSALFSVLATVLLFVAARRLRLRHAALITLAFAFTPAVYVGSVSAMDYLWAAAFLMGALVLALDGRAALAGVALGLATGSRITSAMFLPPLALVLACRTPALRLRRTVVLALTAGLTGAACYVPAYLTYGARFLSYYEPQGPRRSVVEFLAGMLHPAPGAFGPIFVAGQATVGVFGALGGAAVGVCVLGVLIELVRRTPGAVPRAEAPAPLLLLGLVLGVVLPLVLYLRLPSDEGYLIPAVPFLLLVLAALANPRLVRATCLLLMASPFVLGVDAMPPKKAVSPARRSALAREFRLGHETMVIDPLSGQLLMDDAKRRRTMALLPAALEELARLRPGDLLLAGQLEYVLFCTAPDDRGHPRYRDCLSRGELDAWLARGARVVYLPDVRLRTLRLEHYDLRETSAVPLFPDQEGPRAPAPTAAGSPS
jgi:hypothetical protein